MSDLFGIDVAGIVADEMGDGLLPATLKKIKTYTPSTRDPTGPPRTTSEGHSCSGVRLELSQFDRTLDVAKLSSAKVMLLAGTLPAGVEPETGDQITIDGATKTIVEDGVKCDPAKATWTCYVR